MCIRDRSSTIIVEDNASMSLKLSPTALLADKLVPFKSVVPLIVLMLEVPFGFVALSKFNIPTPYTSSTPASPISATGSEKNFKLEWNQPDNGEGFKQRNSEYFSILSRIYVTISLLLKSLK